MLNRYTRAVSANYLFWTLNTLFFLIITPIAIKVMGPELFGLWAILNAVLLFSSVGMLGMGLVVTKFGAEEGETAAERDVILSTGVVIVLPMAVLVALGLFLLRGFISRHMGIVGAQQELFALALILVGFSVIPQFLSRVFQGYLFSQLRYDLGRLVDTGARMFLWVGAVVIASYNHDVAWMAAWGLMVQLVSLFVYAWLMIREGQVHWRWDPSVFRRMGNFSFFTFIQSLAIAAFQNLDRILVGFVLGPASAGVYSVATSVGLRLSVVTGQTTALMVPYASRKTSLGDQRRLYSVFRMVSRLVDLLLMVVGSVLILWMDVILRYWISPVYATSYAGAFRIIIVAYLLLSAARPAHQTLVGMGKVELTALGYLGTSAIMLLSVWLLSGRWGLTGAAGANIWMALLLGFAIAAHHLLGGRAPWRSLAGELGIVLTCPLLSYALVTLAPTEFWWRVVLTCGVAGLGLGGLWSNEEVRNRIRALVPVRVGSRRA